MFLSILKHIKDNFFITGAKYKLLCNVSCMKEVNTDVNKIWYNSPINTNGSTCAFRTAESMRKPYCKSNILSKDAGLWFESFLEILLSHSCFWHILQEQIEHRDFP